MIRIPVALAVLLASGLTSAHAAYETKPLGEPGSYIGCLSIDSETEVGFVAVGQTVAVLAYSTLLRLRKGDDVDGTWNIDGNDERKLDPKADTANTVTTAGLPASRETLALLGNGNNLNVTMGATSVEWSLAGSAKALKDLGACMDQNVKQ